MPPFEVGNCEAGVLSSARMAGMAADKVLGVGGGEDGEGCECCVKA